MAVIRSVKFDELGDYVAALEIAAGRAPSYDALADARAALDPRRTVAVVEDGRIVAGTGSDELELTVPGLGRVAAARITLTAALPTYRRRGFVTAMMTHQLGVLRELGNSVAVFTTSGPGIYGALGYRPATFVMGMRAPTGAGLFAASPPRGTLRLLDPAEAHKVLPETFEVHRRLQPGQVQRRLPFWDMWFLDRELFRPEGASSRFFTVFEDAAADVQGYVAYRLTYGPLREQPVRALVVEDLVAVTDDARLALWSYCLGFEQAEVVEAPNVPPDEPLPWALTDPRHVKTAGLREFLWLRLVDVGAALGARAYGADGAVVFEVADRTCPENAGRYRLEAVNGAATWERTAGPPDLVLDVGDLASCYLGGVSFATLARAGRVRIERAGALALADAMFACRPAPWTVTDW